MWQLVLVHSMLCKVSQLARHSCCSSGCTFPKWGNVLQSALPNLSEQMILQCHFKWGLFCELSFQKNRDNSVLRFPSCDPCQMLPSLGVLSSAQSVQLIKKCGFLLSLRPSHQSNRLCVALLSRDGDQTKNKFLDFWPHVRERVERRLTMMMMMSVTGVEQPHPQALDPFLLRCWKHAVKFLSGKTTVV